jgi:hypothetical protein
MRNDEISQSGQEEPNSKTTFFIPNADRFSSFPELYKTKTIRRGRRFAYSFFAERGNRILLQGLAFCITFGQCQK